MYHLLRAGEDPVAWVSRCAGRMDMVHLKDCAGDGERLVPVGQGTTDWAPILSACRRSGVRWAMVEQESWEGDAFACMEQSLAYMRKMEVNP